MITGKTKIFGLIGDPIKHSLSPAMHNAAFKELGLDCVYLPFKVPKSMLADAMGGVRTLGISGLNVTHPHKEGVVNFLDELNPVAKMVGAVNTIKNLNGKLVGFNTDGEGAAQALINSTGKLQGKKVLVLGAGGAARAIAFSLIQNGVELSIANRTVSKGKALANSIEQQLGKRVKVLSMERDYLTREIKNTDILINATRVGMSPAANQTLVTSDMMHPGLLAFDIVYEPLQTKFIQEARKVGARTLTGIEMLIHQGAISFQIWTGMPAPVDVMRTAAKRELGKE
jgi:shikimate dehydrogenase